MTASSSTSSMLYFCNFFMIVSMMNGGFAGFTGSDRLYEGDILYAGDYIESEDGHFSLVMQSDGNLVGYDNCYPYAVSFWSSGTYGQSYLPYYFKMQPDDNAVIYNSQGQSVWSTQTNGNNLADVYLVMQKDRNIVIYADNGNNAPTVLWQSNTNV